MNDEIMESAFKALANDLAYQDLELLQEVKDLWDVWQWATSRERHWCDDVRLHVSGVHFEIAEPQEGQTKAERRPKIHRFTYYNQETGLRGAIHEAAEWVRKQGGEP